MFEISLVPPLLIGMIWSSVKVTSGSVFLQQRHIKPYLILRASHCSSVCVPPFFSFTDLRLFWLITLLCFCVAFPPLQRGWFSPVMLGRFLPFQKPGLPLWLSDNLCLVSSLNFFPVCHFEKSGLFLPSQYLALFTLIFFLASSVCFKNIVICTYIIPFCKAGCRL